MRILLAKGAVCTLLGIVASASAWAGNVSQKTPTVPKITSVSKITTAEHQTITIKGTGFGTYHAYKGNSRYIQLRDLSKSPVWEAGYSPDGDTVTLIVEKWTNTEIELGGFAGKWGTYNFTLSKGNTERVEVWNWQTGAGPAEAKVKVVVP
jgi:hypothetical protein